MISLLKSIDRKTWKVVVSGWDHPTMTYSTRNVSLKPEISWSNPKPSLANSHALNVIFNRVDQNVFKLINACTSTKEVGKSYKWPIKKHPK